VHWTFAYQRLCGFDVIVSIMHPALPIYAAHRVSDDRWEIIAPNARIDAAALRHHQFRSATPQGDNGTLRLPALTTPATPFLSITTSLHAHPVRPERGHRTTTAPAMTVRTAPLAARP
jgi:hypothetical protein